MTTYVLVAPTPIITSELRRFILISRRHSVLRYTQAANTFTVDVTWPQVLADRWRAYVLSRFGV